MNIFYKFLSFSPILSFSNDNTFGTIERENDSLRFSFIKIPLGPQILHLFSYSSDDCQKFRFFKIIKFLDMQNANIENRLKKKSNEYSEYTKSMTDEDLDIEIDFLKHKIQLALELRSRQFNKVVLYSSILLVITPFLLNSIDFRNNVSMVISIIIIYLLILNILWIYSFTKVKSEFASTFKSLKESDKKKNISALNYYIDWYSIKEGSRCEVGYAKNIQFIFLFTIILLIINSLMPIIKESQNEKLIIEKQETSVLNINIEDKDAIISKIQKIVENISENDYEYIIIQSNNNVEANNVVETITNIIQYKATKFLKIDNINNNNVIIYFVE